MTIKPRGARLPGSTKKSPKQPRKREYPVCVTRWPGAVTKPFRVRLHVNGKEKVVGMFSSVSDALAARNEFIAQHREQLHPKLLHLLEREAVQG
jgi:hypothetical protein